MRYSISDKGSKISYEDKKYYKTRIFKVYTRRCKRCEKFFKTLYRRGRICANCVKFHEHGLTKEYYKGIERKIKDLGCEA